MEKPLSEYTLEELWQLFAIELKEYNNNYENQYNKIHQELTCLLGNDIVRINHIGSTFVKGLIAKPIVDILLEIKFGTDITCLTNLLIENG